MPAPRLTAKHEKNHEKIKTDESTEKNAVRGSMSWYQPLDLSQ